MRMGVLTTLIAITTKRNKIFGITLFSAKNPSQLESIGVDTNIILVIVRCE